MDVSGWSYTVSRAQLRLTRELLARPGALRLESAAFWVGAVLRNGLVGVSRVVWPPQRAIVADDGVGVEITQRGLTETILSLAEAEFIAVRLHTHPGRAYHSDTDDANLVIAHPGAISIVVPRFAADDLRLERCAAYEWGARGESGWRELDDDEKARRFQLYGE